MEVLERERERGREEDINVERKSGKREREVILSENHLSFSLPPVLVCLLEWVLRTAIV